MFRKPFVSIIVPVYNVEQYLEQCIKSLVNQTYEHREILLVDDGSTDASGIICEYYSQKHPCVQVVHKENGGLSDARRVGIGRAAGSHAMFVDGDDWLEIDAVERCCEVLRRNPSTDLMLFSYQREYEGKSLPAHVLQEDARWEGDEARDVIHRRLFGLVGSELAHPERLDNMGSCCMKLYKRELLNNARFFHTDVVGSYEDGLFNIFALAEINSAEYIDAPFYHYRKNEKSLSYRYRPELMKQWRELFRQMKAFIDEHNCEDCYREALRNRIALSLFGFGMNALDSKDAYRQVSAYIEQPEYKNAVHQLDCRHLPVAWRALMTCACKSNAFGVYSVLRAGKVLKKIV